MLNLYKSVSGVEVETILHCILFVGVAGCILLCNLCKFVLALAALDCNYVAQSCILVLCNGLRVYYKMVWGGGGGGTNC